MDSRIIPQRKYEIKEHNKTYDIFENLKSDFFYTNFLKIYQRKNHLKF